MAARATRFTGSGGTRRSSRRIGGWRALSDPKTSENPGGTQNAPARGWRLASALMLAQVAWFGLTSAGQAVTLRLEEILDAIELPAALAARVLDAWVLLPVFGLAALGLRLLGPAQRKAPASFLPLAAIAATSLALALIFVAHRDYLLHRFGTVREGVLYRSAQLGVGTLSSVIERHGLRTLAVLRNNPEIRRREEALAREKGIRFVYLPMGDTQAGVDAFLALMEDPANHPVLIHCRYGIARTGVASAVYRMQVDRWENERALEEARRYGGYDTLEEGSDKRAFILSYEPSASSPELTPP